ncbi:predicted protein [Naegleria gruberi]|uniref:Predicted protein n=1 Tax=Naegleria gruberi TaxID=5762 RepID=D2VN67_NAEGR|nr:uncharacterized protein NAEGRDRAFT_70388 [Naegleria gruberi]EFC41598.1 predicted protein [Naegleria gruberi]|eukprot:XP_002674342.1 predicted protein [Naegleria gruberi strain NEG-M]
MSFYHNDHDVDTEQDDHNHLTGDEVIWRIIQNDQENMHDHQSGGKPPASKTFMRNMEVIWFDPEDAEDAQYKDESCPICGEEYKKGDQCHKLEDCNHFFHIKCLKLWFEKHNTCPMCRKDVLTDDPEYEEQKLDPSRLKDNIHSMYM